MWVVDLWVMCEFSLSLSLILASTLSASELLSSPVSCSRLVVVNVRGENRQQVLLADKSLPVLQARVRVLSPPRSRVRKLCICIYAYALISCGVVLQKTYFVCTQCKNTHATLYLGGLYLLGVKLYR